MTRREIDPIASPLSESPPFVLSQDQVERWAALIADGRDEAPQDLVEVDRERLHAEVRRQLRDRMVRLVARAIATQMHREFGKKVENDNHVRTQV